MISARDLIDMPPMPQTESVTYPVAVFWMSCLEQTSLAIGEKEVAISLSVVSSVHCCIVISGAGEPVCSTFISHRPDLRTGSSTAPAWFAGNHASKESPRQNET